VSWNDREGRVIASRQEQLGSITLSSETFIPTDEQLVPVVTEAIRNSRLALLTMNEAVRQLQGRMKLVRSAFPEKNWPDVTDRALLDTLEEWLAPHCSCAHNTRKLAQIDIAALLKQQLDFRQQRELGTLVPTHLAVPSGSLVRLDYGEEAPVLAVKLQELFGLAEGPTVCEGRTAVVLHLLSPAGRPLQVTRDLKGFWDGSYQQVKKELKGRYPKHPWPDDPWRAVPTRRVKSKM
jgi:ATP-dependent helicase HrpB